MSGSRLKPGTNPDADLMMVAPSGQLPMPRGSRIGDGQAQHGGLAATRRYAWLEVEDRIHAGTHNGDFGVLPTWVEAVGGHGCGRC